MKQLVLLSGGQDSTTCLCLARAQGNPVEAVSFDYGQRHSRELEAAGQIALLLGVRHTVLPVPALRLLKGNALTDPEVEVEHRPGCLPSTFVPGRNLIFLSLACSYAFSRGIKAVTIGVSEEDYSGYPDCRVDFTLAFEETIRLALEEPHFRILTPLIRMTKAESIRCMKALGADAWAALGLSWSCYEGGHAPCGVCPACKLRAKAFDEVGYIDPALRPSCAP